MKFDIIIYLLKSSLGCIHSKTYSLFPHSKIKGKEVESSSGSGGASRSTRFSFVLGAKNSQTTKEKDQTSRRGGEGFRLSYDEIKLKNWTKFNLALARYNYFHHLFVKPARSKPRTEIAAS